MEDCKEGWVATCKVALGFDADDCTAAAYLMAAIGDDEGCHCERAGDGACCEKRTLWANGMVSVPMCVPTSTTVPPGGMCCRIAAASRWLHSP